MIKEKRFFVYFGQNGWPAKFDAVFNFLHSEIKELRVDGMTTAPRLKEFIDKQALNSTFYGEINDSSLLLEEFIKTPVSMDKLEQLEQHYDISLWKILYAERRFIRHMHDRVYTSHVFSHNDLSRIGASMLCFFENALKDIDCLVMPNPASSWAMAAAIVAQNKGIKIRAIRSLAHPNNRSIWGYGPYEDWECVNNLFEGYILRDNIPKDKKRQASEFISKFKEKVEKPLWLAEQDTQSKFSRIVNREKIKKLAKKIIGREKGMINHSLLTFLKQMLWHKLRKKYIYSRENKLFEGMCDEKFVFYALHVEPEAALSVNGQNCLNQTALIEKIALQLPVGWKLYIKEHPTMVGWRKEEFYKHLSKIPNLRNLNPKISSEEIFKSSQCVLTVNGTIGWEAQLHEKPVVTFGRAFYNPLSGVVNCNNLEKIGRSIRLSINNKTSKEELILFVAALNSCSFDLSYKYHWGITDDSPEEVKKMPEETKRVARALIRSLE